MPFAANLASVSLTPFAQVKPHPRPRNKTACQVNGLFRRPLRARNYTHLLRGAFLLLLLAASIAVDSAFGQNNTTAGLAGVGAGAALASTTQTGTTPSSATPSATGGGSSPIEVQIMAFHGLQKIAAEIAGITANAEKGCLPPSNGTQAFKKLRQDIDKSSKDSNGALNSDIKNLNDDLAAIDTRSKQTCAVLIEDPTSANQVALYDAIRGYYGHLNKLHAGLAKFFSLSKPQSTTAHQYVGQTGTIDLIVKNTNQPDKPYNPDNLFQVPPSNDNDYPPITPKDVRVVSATYTDDESKTETPADDWLEVVPVDCENGLMPNQTCKLR